MVQVVEGFAKQVQDPKFNPQHHKKSMWASYHFE
jgi:hypothetical protein